ncbi:EAL domain-containing response regulator, partial [Aliidiomarina sanyensis]
SVFVIDFSLEDSTAIELINTLQQTPSYAFVPKVVITGHRDHLTEDLVIQAGASEYITKPFNRMTFASRIRASHTDQKLTNEISSGLLDHLTNLPTYQGFMNCLEESEDSGSDALSVMVFEVVNLNVINTMSGYEAGDQTLIYIARRLQELKPECGIIARISSTLFSLAVRSTDRTLLGEIFSEIKQLSRAKQQVAGGSRFFFPQIKVGVAIRGESDSLENVINNAVAATFLATSGPFAELSFFSEDASKRMSRTFEIGNALHSGDLVREMFMQYQPQVDLSTGALIGVEALVRWKSAVLGGVPPSEFLLIAEKKGYMDEVGMRIFELVFSDIRQFPKSLRIAINICPKQLQQNDFARSLCRLADRYKIDCSRIEIELTETSALQMSEVARSNIVQLAEHGFQLVLDDFGVGYSNLDYLLTLPISKLKLDRSFVSRVSHCRTTQNILRSLVMLARAEGFTLLAEGVESEKEHQILRKINIHAGQGYHYGRAQAIQDILKNYKAKSVSGSQSVLFDPR